MHRFTTRLSATLSAIALTASPLAAMKASQLTDINGALGRDAESSLESRGFAHVSTNKNSMGYVYSYWWNGRDKNCVQVEVYDGRVQTINDASAHDCGHNQDNTAAVVGVVAGAAILGALLTHKSNHHDNNQHLSDREAEAQYERGYTDGLHNAPYHNYDRKDAYSSGYTAGVDQRRANLSHHQQYGGYVQTAQFNDLRGARAAGGMDELERRGFRQVDNFATGTTRYSIQYRPQSRQCLQVTIADGKFYDLRDIERHPRCR